MTKSIKLKNDTYIDSTGVMVGRYLLSTVLESKVNQSYLGNNPDINSLKDTSGIYGIYNCSQAPNTGIGTLEVIVYTHDWLIQRFTDIQNQHMWERYFTYGTTWSSWVQRW